MAQKEPKDWITVNGKHVPIYDGESKQDAYNRAVAKQNEETKAKQIKEAKEQRENANSNSDGKSVFFEFDWDKLPGNSSANDAICKYLNSKKIKWFRNKYFDIVADVKGDGNYYKLDHIGGGKVAIVKSSVWDKDGKEKR